MTLAEALVEAGGRIYCLDIQQQPREDFYNTQERLAHQYEGTLHYRPVDVQNAAALDKVIASIADEEQRLDGLVAAAGIQYVRPALEYPPERVPHVRSSLMPACRLRALTVPDDEHQLWRRLPVGSEL